MLKNIYISIIILLGLSIPTGVCFAQTDSTTDGSIIVSSSSFEDTDPADPLQAVITSPDRVAVGKSIIFDASESINPNPETPLTVFWTLNDNITENTPEVVHTFDTPGSYTISLTVSSGTETSTVIKTIFVYQSYMILFTTLDAEDSRIAGLVNQAREKNILIDVSSITGVSSEFEITDKLIASLNKHAQDIRDASLILFWTSGSTGLSSLADTAKSTTNISFTDKNILYFTEDAFGPLSRVAQSTFASITPKRIILMRPEARFTILEAATALELIDILQKRDYEFQIIDEETSQVSFLNFMSYIINSLRDKGIATESILLLLMIPVISTLVAFSRQVIGLTTLGVFIPTMLTLTFITLGLTYGLIILLVVLTFGTLTRVALKRFRLLYTPRIAIIMTVVTLSVIVLLFLSSITDSRILSQLSILPIIVVITLVEDLLSIQLERGIRPAILLTLETVFVAVLSYLMIEKWTAFRTLLLGYPEIIFLFIVLNVIMGKYTGLRLTEVFRFRTLLTHIENAEEEE